MPRLCCRQRAPPHEPSLRVKLLLDENLSYRLVALLASAYPNSEHVVNEQRLSIEAFLRDSEESLLILELPANPDNN